MLFLPHDFQKILHEFWKILMEYFAKVVEYFLEVGFRGKRDIFLRISKHTHHTHPRIAECPSAKALRGVCPREILTKTVTQLLTIRVSLKWIPMNCAPIVQSFRWLAGWLSWWVSGWVFITAKSFIYRPFRWIGWVWWVEFCFPFLFFSLEHKSSGDVVTGIGSEVVEF